MRTGELGQKGSEEKMQQAWDIKETWLHRVNPSYKLLLSVVLFLLILLTHNINVLANTTWMFVLLLLACSGHPRSRVLLLLLPFTILFVCSMTSMVFFGKGETTWFRFGLIHVTEESFYRGVHIGLKTVNMALAGLLFALTTRPVMLFYSLMQQLKIPPKYAYSFMAAFRLMPMILDEFWTLRMALKVRGIKEKHGPAGWYGKLRRYAIPLLAQSIRRAQRIAVAMEAKRFMAVKQRTFYYAIGWSRVDLLWPVLLAVLWAAAVWLGWNLPFFSVGDVRYEINS